MSIIAHNLSAMNTSRQWGITDQKKSAIAEKLGSGYQINRAADNAAGLSISEKMRGQIRGLEQASKNIQDGISYVQVADGALNEVHSILQRMRELAVQAANDTNVDADREAIDAEIQQLKEEVDSILEKTEFNTRPVWDIHSDMKKVVGYEKKQALTLTHLYPHFPLDNVNKFRIAEDGYNIKATEEGIQVSWTDYYGDQHLVPEKDIHGREQYIPWPKLDGPILPNRPEERTYTQQDCTISIMDYMNEEEKQYGVDFSFRFSIAEGATPTDLAECLDGVVAMQYTMTRMEVDINSDVNRVVGEANHGVNAKYHEIFLALDSYDKDGNPIAGIDVTRQDDDFLEATSANNVIKPDFTTMTGEWKIEFENPGKPDLAISAISKKEVRWESLDGSVSENYEGGSTLESINYLLTNYGLGEDGYLEIAFPVEAEDNIWYEKTDGSKEYIDNELEYFTIKIEINKNDTIDDVIRTMDSLDYVDIGMETVAMSTIVFSDTKAKQIDSPLWGGTHGINVQVGANMGQKVFVEYDAIRTYSIGLRNTNTLTRSDAGAAITEIDTAIEAVSAQRSYFGAMQNRMEHAHANADNTAENLQSSESRIRDTNMAEGMVEFSKLTILEQASQSMLSHANQANQGILQLLQ